MALLEPKEIIFFISMSWTLPWAVLKVIEDVQKGAQRMYVLGWGTSKGFFLHRDHTYLCGLVVRVAQT